MGTRGIWSIRVRGTRVRFWSQWDSYYSGLGKALVRQILAALRDGTYSSWEVNLAPVGSRRTESTGDEKDMYQHDIVWNLMEGPLDRIIPDDVIPGDVEFYYDINLDDGTFSYGNQDPPENSVTITQESMASLLQDFS